MLKISIGEEFDSDSESEEESPMKEEEDEEKKCEAKEVILVIIYLLWHIFYNRCLSFICSPYLLGIYGS